MIGLLVAIILVIVIVRLV